MLLSRGNVWGFGTQLCVSEVQSEQNVLRRRPFGVDVVARVAFKSHKIHLDRNNLHLTMSLPHWLLEHCDRLKANDTDLLNLNLNIRCLDHRMTEILSEALTENTVLQILNVTATFKPLPMALRPLAETVLPSHPSLKILHLSYNNLTGEAVGLIGRALATNKVLREVYLDYNLLTGDDAIELARGLQDNDSVEVFRLNSNLIDDEGASALADVLRINSTLRELSLARNRIAREGGQALLESIEQDNMTLTSLDLIENAGITPSVQKQVSHLVKANRSGRKLLRRPSFSLWPELLEQSDEEMLYFFLTSKPDLYHSHFLYE